MFQLTGQRTENWPLTRPKWVPLITSAKRCYIAKGLELVRYYELRDKLYLVFQSRDVINYNVILKRSICFKIHIKKI